MHLDTHIEAINCNVYICVLRHCQKYSTNESTIVKHGKFWVFWPKFQFQTIFFTRHPNLMHLDIRWQRIHSHGFIQRHRHCPNIVQGWKVPFTQRTEESPVNGYVNDQWTVIRYDDVPVRWFSKALWSRKPYICSYVVLSIDSAINFPKKRHITWFG